MSNSNAEIELKHIQLELKYRTDKPQHLRHFVDQYYCYKKNYITKSGKANWSLIFFNMKETMSNEAKKIELNKDRNKKVVKEHVVPLKVITEGLKKIAEEKRTSINQIKRYLDKNLKFATITKLEDETLRKLKLQSAMPVEYYQKEHKLYNDPYARYKIAGIKYIVPN